jgi:hypothetical protein
MQGLPNTADAARGPQLEWIPWESPCDNCPLVARCRDEKLACEQFQMFYKFGGTVWRRLPRDPTTRIYRRVFRSGGKAVKPRKTARRARRKAVAVG